MVSLISSLVARIPFPPVEAAPVGSVYAIRSPTAKASIFVVLVVMMLALLWRLEVRDRLQHAVAFLQRPVIERRPRNVGQRKLGVGHLIEEVAQKREPSERLIVEIDQSPRREVGMRRREHHLARLSIIVVMVARLDIDR